jgi:hypothetical protein
MLSRLPPEAAGCSTHVQKLRDSSPKMPSFTKKVMEDRDSEQSPGRDEDSRKDGQDGSEKGTSSFLSSGYAADDISDSPGGFSIFMFSPLGAPKAADQKIGSFRSSRCLGAPSSTRTR